MIELFLEVSGFFFLKCINYVLHNTNEILENLVTRFLFYL